MPARLGSMVSWCFRLNTPTGGYCCVIAVVDDVSFCPITVDSALCGSTQVCYSLCIFAFFPNDKVLLAIFKEVLLAP